MHVHMEAMVATILIRCDCGLPPGDVLNASTGGYEEMVVALRWPSRYRVRGRHQFRQEPSQARTHQTTTSFSFVRLPSSVARNTHVHAIERAARSRILRSWQRMPRHRPIVGARLAPGWPDPHAMRTPSRTTPACRGRCAGKPGAGELSYQRVEQRCGGELGILRSGKVAG